MKYVAAYLLAVLGGNATPDAASVSAILGAAGVEVDSTRLDALISELAGKNLDEVIASGRGKLSSVPTGGAAAAPAAGAAATSAAASSAPAKEEPKKEEKKKEEPEEDEDMGFGLFD